LPEQKRLQEELLKQHDVPDADGFVTVCDCTKISSNVYNDKVTRKTSKRGISHSGGVAVTATRNISAPKTKPGVQDFYRFQQQQQKLNGNDNTVLSFL